jgi:polyphosphate glucokinase
VDALRRLARDLGPADRASVGFPGAVEAGRVVTAPNLSPRGWEGFRLQARLRRTLRMPCRVANDAVLHGWGAVRGRGVEMILTLGTGLGAAVFLDGRPLPLELGHHPWIEGTYEEALGEARRVALGTRRWLRVLALAVRQIREVFRPAVLYLGGGNAARIGRRTFAGATIVRNDAALHGAIQLWSGPRDASSESQLRSWAGPSML